MITTENVVVELPSHLAAELAGANQGLLTDLLQRGLPDLHIEQALDRYRQGGMSFAAAAEQAEQTGVSLTELARDAYVRHMEPLFEQDMVVEELR